MNLNEDIHNEPDPDNKIEELESLLCDLAGTWRGSRGKSIVQDEIVREYHETMATLYTLGWDDILHWECELPEHLLPAEYIRRNGSNSERHK